VRDEVNRHYVRIPGAERPYAVVEYIRDSPNVNVLCAASSCKIYGPFFFAEPTVAGSRNNQVDVLQLWLMPQLQEDSENFVRTVT
jgi:hypothetical protein